MAIKEICAAVEAVMTDALERMGEPVPAFALGIAELRRNAAPMNRIVFVPTAGPISGAKVKNGGGTTSPASVWERRVGVAAHIWGKDIAHCEALLGHLAAAVQDAVQFSGDIVSEDWTAAEQMDTRAGELLVVGLVFKVPLTREAPTSAAVTVAPITTTVVPLT